MNWEQEFDNKFGLNGLHAKPVEYMNYEDISEQVKAFIKQLRQQDNEELIKRMPKEKKKSGFVSLIFSTPSGKPREERISVNTDYDLGWNECLSTIKFLIKDYYKQ